MEINDYYVKAVYDAGISIESNTVSVNIYLAPELLAPTNLQVFVENDSDVQLTWDIPSELATGYMIYRNNELVTSITDNFFWDYSLPNGTYQYYVKAIYAEGISSPSLSVVANIASADVPSNLTATIVNENDVSLTWDNPSNGETAFIINRNGQEIAYLSDVSQNQYTDENLVNAQHTYTIRAVYNNLVSELSNPAYADVMKAHIPLIVDYQSNDDSISLTWEDYSAWGRLVDYSVFKNGQEVTTTSNTYYNESDLANGIYELSVKANYDFASSEQSQPVTFNILQPQLVNNLTTSITDNGIELNWDYPQDLGLISAYKILRNDIVVGQTQANNFLDVNLANGEYSYQVMTYYNDSVENPLTEAVNQTYILAYPVQDLTTSIEAEDIVLSWLAPNDTYGLLNYAIYRNDEFITDLASSESNYIDINPENGLYQYSVKSIYQGGNEESVNSQAISLLIPVSPTNLAISSSEENTSLIWDYTGGDYDFISFEIYNDSELLASTSENTYSLDLANGDYNFSVKTIYSSSQSQASEILAYELIKTYPVTDTNYELIVSDLEISWQLPADTFGLESITLTRETSQLARFEVVLEANTTTYLDQAIANGIYDYTITANYNSEIEADETVDISNVMIYNAYPVTNLNITPVSNDLTLSWDQPQDTFGFVSYEVYQNNVFVDSTEDTSYVFTDQVNGLYSFMVKSIYIDDNEIASENLEYTLIIAYPVENSTIETIDNDIIISWDNPSDVYGLESFTLLNGQEVITETNSLSYTIINADNGVYDFSLRANYSTSEYAETLFAPDYLKLIPHQVISVDVNFTNPLPEISWIQAEDTYGLVGYNVYSLTADQISETDTWTVIDTLVSESAIEDNVTQLENGDYYWAVISVYRNTLNGLTIYSEAKLSDIITDNHPHDLVSTTTIQGNYPNPFNPETTINYQIATDSHVSLYVYNIKGQLVKKLVNSNLQSGKHKVSWTGRDDKGKAVASGIYFFRLVNNGKIKVHKAILMK